MAKGGRALGVSVESGVHYEAQLILFTSHCHLVPPAGKGIQLSVYISPPQISRLNLANFNLASRHSIRNVTKLLTQEMPLPSALPKAVLNSALGLTLSLHIEGLITMTISPIEYFAGALTGHIGRGMGAGTEVAVCWLCQSLAGWVVFFYFHFLVTGRLFFFSFLFVIGRLNHPLCISGVRPTLP